MRLGLLLLVLCVGGCSCGARRPREAPPLRASEPAVPLDPALYDARGRLLVSEEKVGSLVLPVGLRRLQPSGATQIFEGDLPMPPLHAFFRAHLVSRDIDRAGDALRFRNAKPVTEGGIANERYDVQITTVRGGTARVEITPRAEMTRTQSEEETRRAIRDAWRRQD